MLQSDGLVRKGGGGSDGHLHLPNWQLLKHANSKNLSSCHRMLNMFVI